MHQKYSKAKYNVHLIIFHHKKNNNSNLYPILKNYSKIKTWIEFPTRLLKVLRTCIKEIWSKLSKQKIKNLSRKSFNYKLLWTNLLERKKNPYLTFSKLLLKQSRSFKIKKAKMLKKIKRKLLEGIANLKHFFPTIN